MWSWSKIRRLQDEVAMWKARAAHEIETGQRLRDYWVNAVDEARDLRAQLAIASKNDRRGPGGRFVKAGEN